MGLTQNQYRVAAGCPSNQNILTDSDYAGVSKVRNQAKTLLRSILSLTSSLLAHPSNQLDNGTLSVQPTRVCNSVFPFNPGRIGAGIPRIWWVSDPTRIKISLILRQVLRYDRVRQGLKPITRAASTHLGVRQVISQRTGVKQVIRQVIRQAPKESIRVGKRLFMRGKPL